MIDTIQKLIAKSASKAGLMIRRGILQAVGTSGFVQLTASTGEAFDDDATEQWQEYGLSSRAPAGSEAVAVQVDGNQDQFIVVASTNRGQRPTNLASGDACLYASKTGSEQPRVHCKAAGDVDLEVPTGSTVNVGGDASSILLGGQVIADLTTFATSLGSAVPAAAGPCTALISSMAAWPSTKGKVS